MFLDKFIKKIGEVFSTLFNSAKKTWNKISPEIQNGILQGSGIIATVNKYLDAAPDFILQAIQAKFPALPLDKIEESLKKLAKALNISTDVNDPDLLTTIKNLQSYLASTKEDGKLWATISHSAAAVLAVVLAPAETRVAAVVSLLEYAYQHFIKPDVDVKEAA